MPRCCVPARQDGTNVVKSPFFRRLTLRSAAGTAQRAVPTFMFVNSIIPSNSINNGVDAQLSRLKR
jgi:hypothetical protein